MGNLRPLNTQMRALVLLLAAAALPAQTPQEIVRRALELYEKNQRALQDYAFSMSSERRQFESNGGLKSKSSLKTVRDVVDGTFMTRVVERDGAPVPKDELDLQLAKHREWEAEQAKLAPAERAKQAEERTRRRLRELEFLKEMPDALTYTPLPIERVGGRETLVFQMAPKPGYRAKSTQARVFEKTRGKLWIDRADGQFRKMEAEVFDTVSVGGFLARIAKGTQFMLTRMPVAPGVWMLEHQLIRFDVKILLVKTVKSESEMRYAGYRLARMPS